MNKIYTLENENYQIKVSSLGAELKSVVYKNHEYLHTGDKIYWKRSFPVLFPIVGKLKNNSYTYKNKNYTLPQHGFARDSEFEVAEQTLNSLTFSLAENEESLKNYPFRFNLNIKYTLNKDSFEIKYTVNSDKEILFSLGAHPAFMLNSDIDSAYIEFEQKENKDALCLDTQSGCISHKRQSVLTSDKLQLHHDSFLGDALIFKDLKSKEVTLKNTLNKKSVKVSFDGFEYLTLWAPVGAPFVCIEPWCGIADDINTNGQLSKKTSLITLKKDELFEKSLKISLNQ